MATHTVENLKSCIDRCKKCDSSKGRDADARCERPSKEVLRCAARCVI